MHGEVVCTNEDLIRNSAYNWSPMSADEISAKTGIEERRYTSDSLEDLSLRAARSALAHAQVGPEQIGAVLVCTCTSDRLIPSVATWLSGQLGIQQTHCSFDLVAACAGLSYGLAEADENSPTGSAAGARGVRGKVLQQDRERPALPDDLRRRRGRHCRRPRTRGFAAGYRVHADLCQRSDKPGQLDLVAQPRVRQQHHGLRPRGEGARRALPHADARRHQGPAGPGWSRRFASGQHRTDHPAPGEQDHGDRPGEGAPVSPRISCISTSNGWGTPPRRAFRWQSTTRSATK